MKDTHYHLLVGFLQGSLLLMLHQAMTHDWSVLSWPEFLFPAYALVIMLPIVMLLCHRVSDGRTTWYMLLAGLSFLIVLLGVYSGYLALDELKHDPAYVFIFAGSMLVFLYVGLPFIQSYLRHQNLAMHYDDLYEFGWLNTSVMVIAILFSLMVWLVLVLCSGLFSLLSIDLFTDVFYDAYFAYPATAMMFCYGMALGLQRFRIGMVQRIDFFFRAVTILTALIVVLFLMALLLSGLEPLWNTGAATLLLLCLQLCMILFMNGMFQRGYRHREETVILRWSMMLSLLAMPLFSAMSVYAMFLRIDQHGWTVDRIWASIIIAVFAIYALGYAYAALCGVFKRGQWLSNIAPTNICAALFILLCIVLTHSPLFAPTWIAANSQVARLLSEQVSVNHFDFNYLRFELGLAGQRQLKSLSDVTSHPESTLIQRLAKETLMRKSRWEDPALVLTEAETKNLFGVYPKTHVLDDALSQFLYAKRTHWRYQNCFVNQERCLILYIDLNQDAVEEAVIFSGQYEQVVLRLVQGQWQKVATIHANQNYALDVMKERLEKTSVRTEKAHWNHLKIGDERWSISVP